MSKILIVDDDKEFLNSLTELLTGEGFEVKSAGDTYQGMAIAQQEKPNLIILDLKMPGGGGIVTLQNIKNSVLTKDIPIIVLTGFDDPEAEDRVKELGVERYIQKPYQPEDLIKIIKDSCS